MAKLTVVPDAPKPSENKYGIGLSSFSQFIRGFTDDGRERTHDEEASLTVGHIEATPDGRRRYGRVMLKYVSQQTMGETDFLEAGTINVHAQLAEGALVRLLDSRQATPIAEDTPQQRAEKAAKARTDFSAELRRLRAEALGRRATEPLIDAALVAADTFQHDLATIAGDVVAALSSVERPIELGEPLDRISPGGATGTAQGMPA